MSNTFFVVEMTTEHFTFEGCGVTEKSAIEALERALVKHATQYNLDPEWYKDTRFDAPRYEMVTRHYGAGMGYRDHQWISHRNSQ